ncbi:low affinity immunoglobulin epsilon Fc receptor-like [Pomacea canaliculata]|uniref:low affinity immunoglobulin epsilon Fc receptor-like n=1 Tax=Pomacea canaliculata TaxID=400727 RepID=UPI000D7388D1|nr:low affinity immunoglobulin epsilon Fc receptor-like [Pomacea canaliculata]
MKSQAVVTTFLFVFLAMSEQQCPRSWTRFEEACYILPDQNVTWFEARELCMAIAGNLVEVKSADENNFLSSFIKSHAVRGAWIGLEDFVEEGRFVFASNQEVPSYTNWGHGQPDDLNRNQDCVWIPNQPTRWTVGFWDDMECSIKTPTICKDSLRAP